MNYRSKMFSMAIVMAGIIMLSVANADEVKLPRLMVWSAYDIGSSGYSEASGIANALQNKFPTRIRIVPAGTSIGRLLPMTTGKVKYGFLANEVFFASEGIYDFSSLSWGPQDLRVIMGRQTTGGFATAKDTGVKTIADLRGKRIGFVKGNPSVNVKSDAFLAFGGLTRKDVKATWFGSYRAMKDAVITGQLDAFISGSTSSSNMRQIEASQRGLTWPQFEPDNKAGWNAMRNIASFLAPVKETKGAGGLSEANPAWLVGFRYPMITTYAHTSADEVYNLVKAIDETFELYKKTTPSSGNWKAELAGRPPADAPWHEGSIRYAKEKGYWTMEDQAWHDARLARLKKVIKTWDSAVESFHQMRAEKKKSGEKVNAEKAWPAWWEKARLDNLQ